MWDGPGAKSPIVADLWLQFSADLTVSSLQLNRTTVENVFLTWFTAWMWEKPPHSPPQPSLINDQILAKVPSQQSGKNTQSLFLSGKSKCLHYKRWLEGRAGLLEPRRALLSAKRRCGGHPESSPGPTQRVQLHVQVHSGQSAVGRTAGTARALSHDICYCFLVSFLWIQEGFLFKRLNIKSVILRYNWFLQMCVCVCGCGLYYTLYLTVLYLNVLIQPCYWNLSLNSFIQVTWSDCFHYRH